MIGHINRSRYALDITGVNPDNLVCENQVVLTAAAVRVVTPIYGAYFSDSLKLWDVDDRQLIKGVDFKPLEFLQQGFMITGQDIYQFIAILDSTVKGPVRIHRQILGGQYTSDTDVAGQLYEQAANDLRPVHFGDIIGVPEEFPPAWHPHDAPDVMNWGALISAVDRLRSTVNMGNSYAFQTLINYIDNSIREAQKIFHEQSLPLSKLPTGIIDERALSMSAVLWLLSRKNPPSVLYLTPVRSSFSCENKTGVIYFEVTSTKACKRMDHYWQIEHRTTDDLDFEVIKGPLVNYSDGAILEIITNNYDAFHRKFFNVGIFNSAGQRIGLITGDTRAKDYMELELAPLPDRHFLTDGQFDPVIDLEDPL